MDASTQIADLWILICTALVFFMQAGFACLEAGSVRSKNSINVALKNVTDFLVACVCFYAVGYSLMFGVPWFKGIIGRPVPLLQGIGDRETFVFLYQLVFCGTAATIVSGAMAERLRFLPYVFGSAGLSLIIYPLFGYWVWNTDGFLRKLGYHDFAGSSVVHMIGGLVALAGVQKLGARAGRFDEMGRPREFAASDVPMVALGTFILFFGWIGFNGGSAPFGAATGFIVLNTILGGVFGGVTCMLVGWAVSGVSGAAYIMNGVLAGLVAITASADVVTPISASLIGCGGGLAYYFADKLLLRLRLDDAVGAVPVHLGAGIAGILLTGVFAKADWLAGAGSAGLAEPLSRKGFIAVQTIGVGICCLWGYLAGVLLWAITSRLAPRRVSAVEEMVGLNYSEHKVGNVAEEIVTYIKARAVDRSARPAEFDAGEYGRVVSAVEAWAVRIEREREEIERLRGWLDQDADNMHALILRCSEENRLQAQRLESVREKVSKVEGDLRHRVLTGASPSLLAADVLEGAAAKLSEMQAGNNDMTHHWDQLRNLSASLFRNTRTLRGPAQVAA